MATEKRLRMRRDQQMQELAARLDALEAKVDEVLALLKKQPQQRATAKAKQG